MMKKIKKYICLFVSLSFSAPVYLCAQAGINPALRDLADRAGIKIGAAVDPSAMRYEQKYRETLIREYNIITPENAMKFDQIEPAENYFNWDDADYIVNFAISNGMEIRGHNLVWNQQSDWVMNGSYTPVQVSNILSNHIAKVVGRYRGKIRYWDVVNEAVEDNPGLNNDYLKRDFWLNYLGPDYIKLAFTWAHEADPKALLFYNDYNCEGYFGKNGKTEAVYDMLSNMVSEGVPVNGVGFQMHIDASGYPLDDDFAKNLKRFTDLGLQVQITEMDVRLPVNPGRDQLEKQAKIYHDILATCLSNKNVTAFVSWGFSDSHSWINSFMPGYGSALPFDENYNEKPAFNALVNALKGQ